MVSKGSGEVTYGVDFVEQALLTLHDIKEELITQKYRLAAVEAHADRVGEMTLQLTGPVATDFTEKLATKSRNTAATAADLVEAIDELIRDVDTYIDILRS